MHLDLWGCFLTKIVAPVYEVVCAWWPQNPQTAKVREEINRLAKRVKKSEKELEGKRKESAEQEARIRKLQEDERKIAAGAVCQRVTVHQKVSAMTCPPHLVCLSVAACVHVCHSI